MKIALDMDGVIYDAETNMRRMMNERFGYEMREPSPYWFYVRDTVDPEHWRWLWEDGLEELLTTGENFPEARPGVEALYAAGHELHVISNRPQSALDLTMAWLVNWPIRSVTCLGSSPKHHFEADVFVDDYDENVWELLNGQDGAVLMMDRPWNREAGCPWHWRVTWEELPRVVELLVDA